MREYAAAMTACHEAAELHEVRLHGHRVAYRMAGEGPAILLIHGITSSSETWDGVFGLLAAEPHRDRARPDRPRPVGEAARRLLDGRLRERPARPASSPSTSIRRPSSATRSAAGSRCRWPTSSPSAASAWCWSPAAASAARSARCCGRRRCRGSEFVIPLLTRPGLLGAGRGGRQPAGQVGLQARHRPRADRPRLGDARRRPRDARPSSTPCAPASTRAASGSTRATASTSPARARR